MSSDHSNNVLSKALSKAYLEIIPAPGIEQRMQALPAGSYVSITCSPVHGIEPTLELMEILAERDQAATQLDSFLKELGYE